jgi:hypothetical protein
MADIEHLVETLAQEGAAGKRATHPLLLGLKWIAAGAAYIAGALALTGPRPDLSAALQRPWYVAELVALLCLFLAASLGAALLAYPDAYQKRALAYSPLAMFAVFAGVMLLAWRADAPPAPLPVHSFQCTLSITLLALLPAAWTFREMRRYASTQFGPAGSAAVLSAFSLGALWLRLHEVNDSVLHLMQWHYLPMLAAGLSGLWLGRLLLKW